MTVLRSQGRPTNSSVGRQRRHTHLGRSVARQGTHEGVDLDRVPAAACDGEHVHVRGLGEVVTQRPGHGRHGQVEQRGPATAGEGVREVGDREPRVLRRLGVAVEQHVEGDGGVAAPRLGQAHGAHPHDGEPAGARVPTSIVGRCRGPGEDELTRDAPSIHFASHEVPQLRNDLPLVQEKRGLLPEHQARRQQHSVACRPIHIEQDLRAGSPAGRLRLAAELRPFHEHRARGGEPGREFSVGDTRQVGHQSSPDPDHNTRRTYHIEPTLRTAQDPHCVPG